MSPIELATRGFVGIVPYIAAAFVLLFIFKLVHDLITPFKDHEELVRGNAAAGINRGGAYLGFLIAASGSLILSEHTYLVDLGMFMLDGVVAVVVFALAYYAFDHVILWKVNNSEAIQQGNKAVAVLEACAYVALGLIMSASFSGGGQSVLMGLASAVLFSAIGLGTLMAVYVMYDVLRRLFGSYNIDKRVGQGSMTAAIDAGTLLLAVSITLWFSISGDFTGWGSDLLSYAVAAAASIVAVSMGRVIALMTLARGLQRSDDNVARASIVGFVSIGIGFLAGLVTFV
jgi:uncharacterized membrane protein YjfL (UPF0719 family)